MSDKFEDCSATLAPQRMERRRQQLLQEQQRLAEIERAEAAQVHATRSKLDQIATRLDQLPPSRISPQAAFDYVLERMRVAPQKPLTAHGGWSSEELTAVAQVYSLSQAQRVLAALEKSRRPMDRDSTEPPPPRKGVRLSPEEIAAAIRKARGEIV